MRDRPPLSILLGAGASVEAGIPTAYQLVDKILQKAARSDGVKEVLSLHGSTNSDLPLRASMVQPYLSWILERDRSASTDIERLYSCLRLLKRHWDGPLLLPDVRKKQFHASTASDALLFVDYSLHEILCPRRKLVRSKECYYWPKAKYLSRLDVLRKSFSQQALEVFTLNYDISLEISLERYDIGYTTCFSTTRESAGIFKPDLVHDDRQGLSIYKLHGSHRWRQFYPGEKIVELPLHLYLQDIQNFLAGEQEGIECTIETKTTAAPLVPSETAFTHTLSPDGIKYSLRLGNEPQSPAIVWADSNKLRSYNPHRLLYQRFCKHLLGNGIMIAIGYGWKDEGINHAIRESMEYNNKISGLRGLVVVSPDPPDLKGIVSRDHLNREGRGSFAEFSGRYIIIPPIFIRWLKGTARNALQNKALPVFCLKWNDRDFFHFSRLDTASLETTVRNIREPVTAFVRSLKKILAMSEDT